MNAARIAGWALIALTVFALTWGLRAGGYLAPLEHRAADLRARLLQHEVKSDIVIVGIDARSLADLQQWPWPRRYHARVLERLAASDVRRIFIDIDFSARTNPEDDGLLEAALARFDASPVILPTFFQQVTGADSELTYTRPLESLARHAMLAGVNWERGEDSLVRELRTSWKFADAVIPSAVAVVAGTDRPDRSGMSRTSGMSQPIDFSISPTSFEFISYVDLLAGRVAPADLDGRTVLIGATALELNDMLSIPVYGPQPGVVVQALAAQSLREGTFHALPQWLNVTLLALLAVFGAVFFSVHTWRRNLAVLGGVLLLIGTTAIYSYASHKLLLEVVPAGMVLIAGFLIATMRSLDEQTLRALAYALGIKRRDALLRSIVESSTDCIVCVNRLGRIEMANPAGARLFDCAPGALLHVPLWRFVPALAGDAPPHDPFAGLSGKVSEQQACRSDGTLFPIEISVSPVHVQEEPLYTVIVRDITERKAQERKLQYQATHDPLTALPNRAALSAHLSATLGRAQPGRPVALLMLDLCRFKEVNDTLGHTIGDQVLCEVARRFESVSGRGFVSRIGGDEFTMVLDGGTDRDAIAGISRALTECLRTPIDAAGIAIDVGVSIGIAMFPQDAPDAATLLKHADVAMYVAKRRNSAYEFYDAAYDQHSVRRLAMVSELRSAIAAGQLSLHYQPQVDFRSMQSNTVEALLRWKHPDYGAVSPGEFIEIAESTDLIRPLTQWTLQEALLQAARWRQSGFEPRIAVNLSARLLQDTEFPAWLGNLLETSRGRPQALEIEITESAMLLDTARALRVIREIHQLGVMLSIDDFGTGFSSLAYLRDLPVHALKLDKSFVLHMHEQTDDRIIVDSTVQMAHALRLQVVAEGVETEWAARYLARAGYDYAQGFHYSAALPAADCRQWMLAFNASQRQGHATADMPGTSDARLAG